MNISVEYQRVCAVVCGDVGMAMGLGLKTTRKRQHEVVCVRCSSMWLRRHGGEGRVIKPLRKGREDSVLIFCFEKMATF